MKAYNKLQDPGWVETQDGVQHPHSVCVRYMN